MKYKKILLDIGSWMLFVVGVLIVYYLVFDAIVRTFSIEVDNHWLMLISIFLSIVAVYTGKTFFGRRR